MMAAMGIAHIQDEYVQYSISKLILIACAFVFLPMSAAMAEKNWAYRCNTDDGQGAQSCEIFQRLMVQETQTRFAEMAVGLIPGKEKEYQAMIFMPLGLLIPKGVTIIIDDETIGQTIPQFCVADGCLVAMNLQESDLLKKLMQGDDLVMGFSSPNGEDFSATFDLHGFTKALKQLK